MVKKENNVVDVQGLTTFTPTEIGEIVNGLLTERNALFDELLNIDMDDDDAFFSYLNRIDEINQAIGFFWESDCTIYEED